jgi:hypothetical protein
MNFSGERANLLSAGSAQEKRGKSDFGIHDVFSMNDDPRREIWRTGERFESGERGLYTLSQIGHTSHALTIFNAF